MAEATTRLKGRERGLNTASPFELDLGRAIADLSG